MTVALADLETMLGRENATVIDRRYNHKPIGCQAVFISTVSRIQ